MEGLIIMAVLFFFLKSIGQRAKEVQTARQNNKAQNVTVNRQAPPMSKAAQPQQKPPLAAWRRDVAATEGESSYQLVTPSIQVTDMRKPYTGSLNVPTAGSIASTSTPATGEGSASAEGSDTCEPSLAHDRVTPFEPYKLGNEDAPSMEILPEQWDNTTFVRAVVMNEVLNRPRGWRREHG